MAERPIETWIDENLDMSSLSYYRESSLISKDTKIINDGKMHSLFCNKEVMQFVPLDMNSKIEGSNLEVHLTYIVGEDIVFIGKVIFDFNLGTQVRLIDISPYYKDKKTGQKMFPFSDYDLMQSLFEVKAINNDYILVGPPENNSTIE